MITFRNTKNGDARTGPLTDTLRKALQAIPRPLDGETHVFPERDPKVLSRSFTRLTERLSLKDLRFHDLRGTITALEGKSRKRAAANPVS
jgi:hypothetical protein